MHRIRSWIRGVAGGLLVGLGAVASGAQEGVVVPGGGGATVVELEAEPGTVPGFATPPAVEAPPGAAPGAPRPRIVVLLHGMLTNAGDRGALATARSYWSFEFVQGLLGADAGTPLATLAGTTLRDHEGWLEEAEGVGRITQRSAGYAFVAVGGEDARPASPAPLDLALPAPGRTILRDPAAEPPALSVMLTARDASVGLLTQSKGASRQIGRLLRWFRSRYQEYFDERCRCEPELILVGHSMGGLVSRVLVSDPDPDPDDAVGNPDGVVFTRGNQRAMDAIRDRTAFLVTLGTPHDGTIFADRGYAAWQAGGAALAAAEAEADALVQALGAADAAVPDVTEALVALLPDAVRDLRRAYLDEINRGFLHPGRAVRSADAEALLGAGTGGAPIPIYAFGGRSPGSVHLDDFDLAEGAAGILAERPGDQTNILLKLAIDGWMATWPDGWGALEGVFADHAGALDRIARAGAGDVAALAASFEAEALDLGSTLAILQNAEDLTDFLLQQAGAAGPGVGLPIYLRERFEVQPLTVRGVPLPALACRDFRLGLELLEEPLLALGSGGIRGIWDLVDAGGTLEDLLALAGTDLDVASLRDAVREAVTGVVRLPPECLDPRAWRLVTDVQVESLPALVGTGEPVADGEIDTDGAVSFDSAMGFLLGTDEPFAFDHAAGGAWYRCLGSPFEEEHHEGMNVRGPLGRHLHDELVVRAGPLPAQGDLSVYP